MRLQIFNQSKAMNKIMYVTIALAAIFLSCKKDDVSSGTKPRKAITRADLYPENGYISGTITSAKSNGTSFTKQFTHQLDSEMSTYYISERGAYVIHLNKLDKYGRVGENDKKTEITFTLNSAQTDVSKVNQFYASVYIDSSATSITKFNIDSDVTGIQSLAFSNIMFNPSNGMFTCDYNISVTDATTSSRRAAVVVGKINTTLTNIRYRTGS